MVVGVGWLAHCWVSEGSDSFYIASGVRTCEGLRARVWVSFEASLPDGGVVALVDWAGHWFVNSGREHLVAIREFNDIARRCALVECVWCVVFLVFVLFLL